MVTAAAADVPAGLVEQLATGGRLVIPVGDATRQELRLLRLTADGLVSETIETANFVPLIPDSVDADRRGTGR